MAETEKVDVVVLGAGPAGYVCAIRLAQLGKKVTVIDKAELGGVCLNRGCIPSKALIYASTLYEKMGHASELGINVKGVDIDLPKMMSWKESIVNKLTGGVGQLLKANGCDIIRGEAKFKSSRVLEVKSGSDVRNIEFEKCVIATGSRPTPFKGFEVDQKGILDSTGALELKKLPKSLLGIGGGYIGLELGTFYAKLGTKVTVVEAGSQLLGMMDPELVRVVELGLKKRKVEIFKNTYVLSQKKSGDGFEVEIDEKSKGKKKIKVDKILVTIGRTPNTDSIDLEKAGLKKDKDGFILVNNQLMTDIPGIYAIGDVAGQPLLAHKGSKEGIICAEVISGKRSAYDVVAMPAVVFTDPEVATVGMSQQEAVKNEVDYMVGIFPFAINGRALSISETDGFVKLIGDKKTGRLLGAHIVGPEASNLIAECALALELGATIEDIAMTVHAHPTLPEALMEGAEAALGHAIHIYKPKRPQSPEPQMTV